MHIVFSGIKRLWMVEAIKIYTSPEVLERLMSIIRINKPSLWKLSPQEHSHLYPCTIIVFGWVPDKSDSAAHDKALVPVYLFKLSFHWLSPVKCDNSKICIHQLICVK